MEKLTKGGRGRGREKEREGKREGGKEGGFPDFMM